MSTKFPDGGGAQVRKTAPSTPHWLVRRNTIAWLWVVSLGLLTVLVAADVLLHGDGHGTGHGAKDGAMAIAGGFGFYAWYGFATCAAMVVFAKLLSMAVKRPDNYYLGEAQEQRPTAAQQASRVANDRPGEHEA